MSVLKAVEVSDRSKQELIRRTLVNDVQRRTVARYAMHQAEVQFKEASDEYDHANTAIEEHLLDLGEVMGLGEPPPEYAET